MAFAALGAAALAGGAFLGTSSLIGTALMTIGTSLIGSALTQSLAPDEPSGSFGGSVPAPPQLAPPPPVQYAPPPPQIQTNSQGPTLLQSPEPDFNRDRKDTDAREASFKRAKEVLSVDPPEKLAVKNTASDQAAKIKQQRRQESEAKERAKRNRARRSGARPKTQQVANLESSAPDTNLVTLLS